MFTWCSDALRDAFEGSNPDPLSALLVTSVSQNWDFYFIPVLPTGKCHTTNSKPSTSTFIDRSAERTGVSNKTKYGQRLTICASECVLFLHFNDFLFAVSVMSFSTYISDLSHLCKQFNVLPINTFNMCYAENEMMRQFAMVWQY